jgi:diacylglycerol kinase family enzyme
VVLKTIFKFKEPLYTIQIDNNEPMPEQALMIVNIANSSRTGGGFMISPHAQVNDEKLNLLYCSVPSIFKRLALFLKVGSGKHINSNVVHYCEVNKVSISSPTNVKAQLDGELIEASSFEIGLADWKLIILT